MAIRIPIERVGKIVSKIGMRTYRACWQGAQRGAFMGKRHLVGLSPTDRGDLRRSWTVKTKKVKRRGSGRPALLVNDAPHAGIIEGGARPHPVNRAGIESIAAWVARKRRRPKNKKRTSAHQKKKSSARPDNKKRKKRSPKKANKSDLRVAFAIAAKIKKEGQKPTFFVRNELVELASIANDEVSKKIQRIASRPPK